MKCFTREWHMSLSSTTYLPQVSCDPSWERGVVQDIKSCRVSDGRSTVTIWWTALPICKWAQNQAEWGLLKPCCLCYLPLLPPASPNLCPGTSTADYSFCRNKQNHPSISGNQLMQKDIFRVSRALGSLTNLIWTPLRDLSIAQPGFWKMFTLQATLKADFTHKNP